MAKPDSAKIEKALRKFVREAKKNGEEVAINEIRRQTEEKLGLEKSFLKDEEWKSRSKDIIKAEFEGSGEQTEEQAKKPAEKVQESAAEPQKSSTKSGRRDNGAPASPKRPEKTAPKVNGVKRKASESESGSGSTSTESESAAPETPSKKAKVDKPAAPAADPGPKSAASSSGSDESSEEDSSDGESDSSEPQKPPSPRKAAAPATQLSIQSIPAQTFIPQPGYTPLDPSQSTNTDFFSTANLSGKQIWHIAAPSNVPLSSLTELTLASIQSGDSVLSHKGIAYILSEDKTAHAESTSLLAPSKDGYVRVSMPVSRTLQLQQKIELPNLSALQASQNTGSNAAGDVAQAAVSTARPQPKGLRMRFKPPGFGKGRPGKIGSEGESGDEDDGDNDKGPSFQFPKSLGQHGVEVRQDGDVEMVDAADVRSEGTPKKAKKKREEKEGEETPKVNGVSNHAAEQANGAEAEKETKEERRRRKEEKRARKEAKAKAKGVVT